jgi:hypothetical protein
MGTIHLTDQPRIDTAALGLHPAWTVLRLKPGTSSLFSFAVSLIARRLPPPTAGYRTCPPWIIGGHVHDHRGRTVSMIRYLEPAHWPEVAETFRRWRAPLPEVLREGQAREGAA